MSSVTVRRLSDPNEKLVIREGCVLQGEVCEVVPRTLVQKVAEYRIFAEDFVANILRCPPDAIPTPGPGECLELQVEDCGVLARTVEFDARAIFNKVFNTGSIKIAGTARYVVVDEDGRIVFEGRQCPFFVRAVFQEIEPIPGVRDTDQVLEQLEFVEGCDISIVGTTDPETGEEADLIVFKASLIVEKRIFRCTFDDIPVCPTTE